MASKNANAMDLNAVAGICTWDGTSVLSTAALTQYNVLTGGASANAFNQIAPSTAGQLFTSAGASSQPTWTTSTYPGTNAINTLLYASAANTMSALATADTGVLLTNGSGVPAWTTAGTSYSPTCVGSTTAGTTSYTTQVGRYIVIGPLVLVEFNVQGTFGNTAAGNITISLPITCVTVSNINTYGCGYAQQAASTYSGSYQVSSNKNSMIFLQFSGSAVAVVASDTFNMQGTITYFGA